MNVGSLLKGGALVLQSNATLQETVRIMAERNVGLLPIVDDEGRPLAVISERDVISALAAGASLDDPALAAARRGPLITVTPDVDVHEALVKMRQGGACGTFWWWIKRGGWWGCLHQRLHERRRVVVSGLQGLATLRLRPA